MPASDRLVSPVGSGSATASPGAPTPGVAPAARAAMILAPLLELAGPCLRSFAGTALACAVLGIPVAGAGTWALSRADAGALHIPQALHIPEAWRVPALGVAFVLLAASFAACGAVLAFARAVGGAVEAAVRRHGLARRTVDAVATRVAGQTGRQSIADAERGVETAVAGWLAEEAAVRRGWLTGCSVWLLRRALVRPVAAVMKRALRAEQGDVDAPRVFAALGAKAEDLVCQAIRSKARGVTLLAVAGMLVVAIAPFAVAFAPR